MWWSTFREAQFLCSRLKWKPQLNVFVPTYLPPRDMSPPGPPRFPHLAQGPPQGTAAHLSSWGPLSCLAGRFRANKQMKLSGLTNRPFCWTAKHGAPIKSWKQPFFFPARWRTGLSWQRPASIQLVWRADEHMEMCGVNLQGPPLQLSFRWKVSPTERRSPNSRGEKSGFERLI